MNPTTSPARRVLGEKDANALLHTQSARKANRGLENASPVAQRPSLKRPVSLSPISRHAGQKRKIEEAYEQEMPGLDSPSRDASMAHPMSQMTEMLSDSPSEHEGPYKTSVDQYKSTPNTVFSSFRPSQDEPCPVEAQFEIHEEPSQQTLDTMHAITLPQNTSQLMPSLRPNLFKEGSQVSLSMSSLIDFENNRSSEGDDDDGMQMLEEHDVVPDQRPKTQEESRKEMLLEKAETLRTRLQLAIFKIQTNQVSRPFARLQIPEAKARSSSPDLAALSSSSPGSSSTVRAYPGPGRSPAVTQQQQQQQDQEARVASARARATMGPNPKVRSLSSLPMPSIAPTAFSARWNNELELEAVEQTTQFQRQFQFQRQRQSASAHFPSSPPLPSADLPSTARHPDRRADQPKTPMRSSSSTSASASASASASRHADNYRANANSSQRRSHHRPGGLTSSVVKGEAASSLLELVRGGAGAGAGAARSGGTGMCGL
ncbi:hypothetical protein A1O3_03535 [Capronia epimyces CBS 606.96]|uniref:Uncharacterized protein n=1 Tax=Capronia epimyces CBS 606.96 TaxID=1182542 RepID=W9Y194_9EURO|nr:uncharacterized protein A1O3_03535 [Capronia epimyces CBS 606.96]EXJ86582.1 hypothetical protein A1O3_03535 [Capronia epimyces CBS 606.96]